MTDQRPATDLLLEAGRLLLEYNESTAAIHLALSATAKAVAGQPCHIKVSYRGVAVSLAGETPGLVEVEELRYNTAVQSRVHQILTEAQSGRLVPEAALSSLRKVEADTPRYPRWFSSIFLGLAAASFARLLGADGGATAITAVATGLGLLVRQEIGRRGFSPLVSPLTAALIGAIAGGLAIRLGWTASPELVLIVPALMLVPGPHLINGLLDLIDNHLPMSLARFGLATGLLTAAAAGVALGVELTLPDLVPIGETGSPAHLNLASDAALAGIATCGFAVFYNTAWRQLGTATLPGMIGHGLRFVVLEASYGLVAATFLGGLAVGVVAAVIARWHKVPVAVMAFAGAVTMIPGLSIYRALAGAFRLARLPERADPDAATAALSHAVQSCLVVGGLTLGLIVGARAVSALAGELLPTT
ncbi:MAG TPA: threonine/serine exporter family protein [Gemmataceae bacterium]|nr:threonine/serine exporter family protein [Gemmataceae bacterium]